MSPRFAIPGNLCYFYSNNLINHTDGLHGQTIIMRKITCALPSLLDRPTCRKIALFLLLTVAGNLFLNAQMPTRFDTRSAMRRVADWQIAHFNEVRHSQVNWVNATFYLGLCRWAAIAERDNRDSSYFDWLMRIGDRNQWNVDHRYYHADDICVGQAYLLMHDKYKRPEMLAPTRERADWVVKHPSKNTFRLDYGDTTTIERWTWCDALFMAPPVYLHLYNTTGDKKYIRFMDKEYKATYDYLFSKPDSLFYRDWRYFDQREANGRKVFWGRGNGWVLGGLVEILRGLPAHSKYRKFYQDLFVRMAQRIARCQGDDGFWHASLLDPASYPSPETSASGFFVYALAYGINEGLLPRDTYLPIVEKGWNALLSAVEEDGKLGYVQPIGADPKKVTRDMTEVYGPGAFLLAGTELYRLAQEEGPRTSNISPQRVAQIAAMLPDAPKGIGLTYKDRKFWDRIASRDSAARQLIKDAPALMAKGMPPFIDSLYLHLNKTNVRLPGEKMMDARFQYLFKLTLAECLENKQRYVPAIEQALISLCRQKPWSIPAHDRELHNFNGTDYSVDLVVATSGNGIAQCVYMLDDKLSPEVKARVQCAFQEKVFRPVMRGLERNRPFWWFTATNNWNSVCLAGVTGAALTLIPDREERAYFVAAAEKYNVYGMKGYAEDGYCSEGVGYYNYGFRAYILLREEVCRATNGEIDFFNTPKFVQVARFGRGIQMYHGLCPAYSDCKLGAKVDEFINIYCDNALGLGQSAEKYDFPATGHNNNLSLYLIQLFPHQAWKLKADAGTTRLLDQVADPLHSFFDKAGILIARPAQGSTCRMAVSVKGGSNAENHNHNDVGSYVVSLGDELMAGDQGGPYSYPGDYFTGQALEKYPIKGSYGHPVPVIDGKRQFESRQARGIIEQKRFTTAVDTLAIDMTSAYAVPQLEKLTRTFRYDRTGNGSFSVADRFSAQSPVSFETALTTAGKWRKIDANHLVITVGQEEMTVSVKASGKITISAETIQSNSHPYTRIGIALKRKARNGSISLTMTPRH